MPRAWTRIAAASLLAVAPPAAAASEPAKPPAGAAYALPETQAWDMTAQSGRTYRILVSLPPGTAPDSGYPVLYVLDGNAMFAGFAEARRIQALGNSGIDKMIIVGIGYPGEQIYDSQRMLDFIAPIETPALKQLYEGYPAGDRDRFGQFLLEELRPAIEKRYAVDSRRQALYGHSLGGLFALHMLYSHPGAFRTIIAASPSIWWDNQAILSEERAFKARIEKDGKLVRGTLLVLIAGEREQEGSIAGDTAALGRRFAPLSGFGLRSEVVILDGEDHLSVPHRSITTSLRAATRRP